MRAAGIFAGLLGLAAIAAVISFNLANPPIEVDQRTLCPRAGPVSKTVVLVDVSDPLPPLAQHDAENEIAAAMREIPKFGLLELRLLDPRVEGGQVLFSRCNPGDGRDLSEIIANPEMERRKFEEGFTRPLAKLLGAAVQSEPAQSSPIMETLQWIAVKTLAAAPPDKPKSTLILVSDMIQHSDNYSFYKGNASFERFRRSATYAFLRTDFHSADAVLFFVHRQNAPATENDLLVFWEQWFADNNGALRRVRKIQGTQ